VGGVDPADARGVRVGRVEMITISVTTILWVVVGLAFAGVIAGLQHSYTHTSGSAFPLPGGTGCAWAVASAVVFLLALGCAIGRMF
jgi:hypothetical protein